MRVASTHDCAANSAGRPIADRSRAAARRSPRRAARPTSHRPPLMAANRSACRRKFRPDAAPTRARRRRAVAASLAILEYAPLYHDSRYMSIGIEEFFLRRWRDRSRAGRIGPDSPAGAGPLAFLSGGYL